MLDPIVSAFARLGQGRFVGRVVAVAALWVCLTTYVDLSRLMLAGAIGLVALSLGLFREASSRLLFIASGAVLLTLYLWAGSEAIALEVGIEANQAWASVGGRRVSAELPAVGDYGERLPASGRLGLAIAPATGADLGRDAAGGADWLQPVFRLLTSNLAAGVTGLEVFDGEGGALAGPLAFWQGEGDGAVEAGTNEQVESGDGYAIFGERGWRDLRATLDLRNGGPPVTLLMRLNDRLDGLAIQAWPAQRELSIHLVSRGVLGRELAGGYQTLKKPAWAGLQTLLREVLRAWLTGLLLLASGALLAPLARLLPGLADWRAPAGTGLAFAALLGLLALLATARIATDVLEGIPHVQDSVAYLFQARTFALGRLSVPLPAVPEAFEHEFILMRDGAWFSKYPPGHPLILGLGVLAGHPALISPIAAGLTVLLVYSLGRTLFGGGTGLLAAILLLSSPFFLFMSGSMMAHPTGLLLATIGLLCAARAVSSESTWLPVVAGLSLGWLTASRQLSGLAITLPVATWLLTRRLRAGRSIGAVLLLALGWSWPVLGLLAYNRALTGDPLLNPFQLWWPFDRFGFGPDVGLHGGHDLAGGFWNTYANFSALETELFGWPTYLTLAFAVLPFATGRARAGDWLCAATTLSLIGSYVGYWADGLMFGPRYYYEACSCLALLTARGAICAAEATSGAGRSILQRRLPPYTAPLFVVIVLGLVAGNLVARLPEQVAWYRGYNFVSGYRQAVVRAAGLHQALVFVPTTQPLAWWEYGSVFSANDPLLQADVIYARDLGPDTNRRTMAAFPDRAAYRLIDGVLTPMR